jgi:hypothetical protein
MKLLDKVFALFSLFSYKADPFTVYEDDTTEEVEFVFVEDPAVLSEKTKKELAKYALENYDIFLSTHKTKKEMISDFLSKINE